MRRIPLCAVALFAASMAFGQVPRVIAPVNKFQPLPFLPYRPPTSINGLGGAAYLNKLVPDTRELSGAAFMNTEFEPRRDYLLYGQWLQPQPPEPEPVPFEPEFDPSRVYLTLQVPDKADVFVQGRKMETMGPNRLFVSPPLDFGPLYRYKILVRWLHDGDTTERRFDLPVQPGDRPVLVVLAPLAK